MHQLVVPLPQPGFQVDTDQALAEQIVSGPVSAIEVPRRRLHRQVDQSELLINGNLSPHTGVSILGPGIIQPRFVAKFAGHGDGMKYPKSPARPNVVSADVPFVIFVSSGRHAFPERSADNHHIPGHDRRRLEPDLPGDQIDVLIDFQLQIHRAVLSEGGHRDAGPGIQGDEAIARSHIQNPLLVSVGPVRQPSS